MKKRVLGGALAGAMVFSACTPGGVAGSGKAATETRDVAAFDAVSISCLCTVELQGQQTHAVTVSGDDNIVPLIRTEVQGNTLTVRSPESYDPDEPLRITIGVPDLQRFAMSGAGRATLKELKGERLAVSMSGAGALSAAGEVGEVEVTLSGAGRMDAKELRARKATAQLSGTGSISVHASEELEAHASGVGSIEYYGDPKIANHDVSGVGKITKR